eukprot:evm.model.scf_235.12 EVM.evm.TU.scf_235.12   scf_235:79461-80402(-)
MHRPGELAPLGGRDGIRAAHLERMEHLGMIQREFWIECDCCHKWRRTTPAVAESNTTRRWVCRSGGRGCGEPCDYCLGGRCRCESLGDDGSTWCVSQGYNVPNGFSLQVKARKGQGQGGAPGAYVVYTAFCDKCGSESGLIDRRSRVEAWLKEHGGCRPEWGRLTPGDFDFRVDEEIRRKLAEAGGGQAFDGGPDAIPAGRAGGGPGSRGDGQAAEGGAIATGLAGHPQAYARPIGGYDSIGGASGPSLFRPGGGMQLWGGGGSMGPTAGQGRQAPGGGFPQGVQYRPVWAGAPYGQPYGWVPIADHPQFRNI